MVEGCAVYGASCYFLGLATILSLAVLAVFRYIKICFAPRGKTELICCAQMSSEFLGIRYAAWLGFDLGSTINVTACIFLL